MGRPAHELVCLWEFWLLPLAVALLPYRAGIALARWCASTLPLYDERFQQALRIGGRLFVVVGQAPVMEAWQVTRVGDREWQRVGLLETVIAPLVNAPRPSEFVF